MASDSTDILPGASIVHCYNCTRVCSPANGGGGRYLCIVCSKTRAFCKDCKVVTKHSALKSEICRSCTKEVKRYSRICHVCRVNAISPDENDDIDMCSKCYYDENTRECSVCKKRTIHPNAPSFVNICYGCKEKTTDDKSGKKGKPASGYSDKPGSKADGKCSVCSKKGKLEWQRYCDDCFKKR